MKNRTCGQTGCGKTTKKYGEPVLYGHFLDQIVICSCGWNGVHTETLTDKEVDEYLAIPKQIGMFDNVPSP